MPLISVIINVRNGAATLREAIDSVLSQSFGDWELIVWDDCSTDASASIVASYGDPRVRYFLSPNDVPLGKARNDAIQRASGEWIAFLDQDDVWLAHKLEKQIALASDIVGLIYGRTVRFYPSGWERDYDHAHEYQLLPEGDLFTLLFTRSCFIAMSSAMFRSSAIKAIGGIPDSVRIIPDYYLYVAVARKYQRAGRAGSGLPISDASRQHVPHGGPGDELGSAVAYRSLGAARFLHRQPTDRAKGISPRLPWKRWVESRRFCTGLKRLFSQGSVGSQIRRPFAFVFHVVRRKMRPPYWQRIRQPDARVGSR